MEAVLEERLGSAWVLAKERYPGKSTGKPAEPHKQWLIYMVLDALENHFGIIAKNDPARTHLSVLEIVYPIATGSGSGTIDNIVKVALENRSKSEIVNDNGLIEYRPKKPD